ncbi:hypothetical protein GJ496_009222 [Pomphorhynchus laevis]|nr:hypothetical protein GJ496_009222 [Pomphorhynchus laevis]
MATLYNLVHSVMSNYINKMKLNHITSLPVLSNLSEYNDMTISWRKDWTNTNKSVFTNIFPKFRCLRDWPKAVTNSALSTLSITYVQKGCVLNRKLNQSMTVYVCLEGEIALSADSQLNEKSWVYPVQCFDIAFSQHPVQNQLFTIYAKTDSLLGCLHIRDMLCCAYQIGRQMRVMVDRFICQNSLLHALFWSEESTNLFMGLSWLKDFENLEWITEPTDKSDIIGFILHGSVSIFKLISSKSVKQLNLSYQSECMQTEHHVSKRMKHILKGKSDHNSSNASTIATTESNDLSVNQQNSLKTTKSDNLEYGQCIAHVKTHGYVFLKYKNKNLFKYRSHGKSYILFIRCKHLSDVSIFGRLIVDKLRVKYNEFMLNSNHTNIDQRDLLNIANAMPYIIDEIDQFVCSKDDFISDKESELHLKHVLTPQMASQYSLFK